MTHMPLRLIPLGGVGEIGMNCMVLEYENEILIIDCGILFSDLEQFGVEFVIPDFTYLKDHSTFVKGIICTHGHEDHIGALPFLLKSGINAPIYASPFTSKLLQSKLKEYELGSKMDIKTFQPGQTIQDFTHFKIKTIPVNHSIIESSALIIDTPVGKIVHTGDFKIDLSPYYGKPIVEESFRKVGDENVLLLLSDSTNIEKSGTSLSENTIYQKFRDIFVRSEGLTVVSMFASNISRIGQMLQLAKELTDY